MSVNGWRIIVLLLDLAAIGHFNRLGIQALRVDSVLLGLWQRTRDYVGCGSESPSLELAFLVSSAEVDEWYELLPASGVRILDQPRGHRTVYFADAEGSILDVFAEI